MPKPPTRAGFMDGLPAGFSAVLISCILGAPLHAADCMKGNPWQRSASSDKAEFDAYGQSSRFLKPVIIICRGEKVKKALDASPIENGEIQDMRFSDDGKLLVSLVLEASRKGASPGPVTRLRAWKVSGWKLVQDKELANSDYRVILKDEDRLTAVGWEDRALAVRTLPDWEAVLRIDEDFSPGTLTFSNDHSRVLALADKNTRAKVFNLKERKLDASFEAYAAVLGFAADEKYLIGETEAGFAGGRLTIWSAEDYRLLCSPIHPRRTSRPYFTPDGKHVLTEGGNVRRLWEIATCKLVGGERLPSESWDKRASDEEAIPALLKSDYKETDPEVSETVQITAQPKNAKALQRRALQTGKTDPVAAISDLNAAIKIMPSAAMHRDRGLLHNRIGEYAKGLADLNEALRMDPSLKDAYYHRGLAHQALGDCPKALRDYSKAIQLGAGDTGPYLYRGIIRYQAGEYGKAEEDLRAVLRQAPRSSKAHFTLGLVQHALGQWTQAISEYNKSFEEGYPCSNVAYRGIAYFKNGQDKEAMKDLQKAMSCVGENPNYEEIYSYQAAILFKQGEMLSALNAYDDLIKLSKGKTTRLSSGGA